MSLYLRLDAYPEAKDALVKVVAETVEAGDLFRLLKRALTKAAAALGIDYPELCWRILAQTLTEVPR